MTPIARKTLAFAAFVLVCLAVAWPYVRALVQLALAEDSYSHILLIPLVSAALVWMQPGWASKLSLRSSPRAAATVLASSALLLALAPRLGRLLPGDSPLPFAILGLVGTIWAGFLFFFGAAAFRALQFPLVFLVLAVPPPAFVIDGFVEFLRNGSATVTHILFRLTGTPVFRTGYIFVVPGASIDIAPECSGIRSALAMLVTCLIAGHLFLRNWWARITLLVLTVPMLVIKNGIRIVTLTLLATHVDPSFLTGKLHQRGGFVFFLIGLLILWPFLLWLQKVERRSGTPPISAASA